MVLVVVAAIVVAVAVFGAETSGVGTGECMLLTWSDFDRRTVSIEVSERK
jgi:hypothetical protein